MRRDVNSTISQLRNLAQDPEPVEAESLASQLVAELSGQPADRALISRVLDDLEARVDPPASHLAVLLAHLVPDAVATAAPVAAAPQPAWLGALGTEEPGTWYATGDQTGGEAHFLCTFSYPAAAVANDAGPADGAYLADVPPHALAVLVVRDETGAGPVDPVRDTAESAGEDLAGSADGGEAGGADLGVAAGARPGTARQAGPGLITDTDTTAPREPDVEGRASGETGGEGGAVHPAGGPDNSEPRSPHAPVPPGPRPGVGQAVIADAYLISDVDDAVDHLRRAVTDNPLAGTVREVDPAQTAARLLALAVSARGHADAARPLLTLLSQRMRRTLEVASVPGLSAAEVLAAAHQLQEATAAGETAAGLTGDAALGDFAESDPAAVLRDFLASPELAEGDFQDAAAGHEMAVEMLGQLARQDPRQYWLLTAARLDGLLAWASGAPVPEEAAMEAGDVLICWIAYVARRRNIGEATADALTDHVINAMLDL